MLPYRFGLRLVLGLQGMPISLGFWEWGCPKRGNAHNIVTATWSACKLVRVPGCTATINHYFTIICLIVNLPQALGRTVQDKMQYQEPGISRRRLVLLYHK